MIASVLKVWSFIGGPASGYEVDQEDSYRTISNSFEGVVVGWRGKAGNGVLGPLSSPMEDVRL
ncbi:hypothetical protein [uncultured Tateyamaria sp.]|uniref:hypothetical protein n=1 Tax=uncultured Tateyamaria sp. TaxID=455651 RepID=UPI002631FDFA|nr:hypothetical protein [uncultured Tateyamaria sp.]